MAPIPWQTPIVEKGIMYVADGSGAYAVKLPATVDGKPEKLWEKTYGAPRKDRYYASPVLYEGLLYSINRNGILSVMNASNGELVYEQNTGLKRTIYPSPALIGKHLFLSNDQGKIIIIKPGKTYSVVSENSLEPFRSCPVVYNGKLFIRGLKNLYCIGK